MNFTDRFLAVVTFFIGALALVYVVRTWKPVASPAPYDAVASRGASDCADLFGTISERK